MKRKIVYKALPLVLCGLMISGCGKKEEEKTYVSVESSISEDSSVIITGKGNIGESGKEDDRPSYANNLGKETNTKNYITLPAIEGVVINVEKEPPVTESDARQRLYASEDKTLMGATAVVEEGDTVNVTFSAEYKDEEKDAGSVKNKDIVIGSNNYYPEFESALIGLQNGFQGGIEVTYGESQYVVSGKTVSYHITINSISRYKGTFTQGQVDSIVSSMEEERNQKNEQNKRDAIISYLKNASEYSDELPQNMLESARKEYDDKYTSGYVTLDDYLKASGKTKEEYKDARDTVAIDTVKEKLVYKALEEMYETSMDGQDFYDYITETINNNAYTDDDVENIYDEDNMEVIYENYLCDKAAAEMTIE